MGAIDLVEQRQLTERPAMKSGDTVRAGQVIGRTGTTGHSTGPHLHFQVNLDGEATDPVAFMRVRGIRL